MCSWHCHHVFLFRNIYINVAGLGLGLGVLASFNITDVENVKNHAFLSVNFTACCLVRNLYLHMITFSHASNQKIHREMNNRSIFLAQNTDCRIVAGRQRVVSSFRFRRRRQSPLF